MIIPGWDNNKWLNHDNSVWAWSRIQGGSCLQIKLIRITLLHHTFIYNIFCLNDIECPEVWNIFHSQLVSFTFSVVSTSLIHFLWDKIVEIFLTKWKCITVNYFLCHIMYCRSQCEDVVSPVSHWPLKYVVCNSGLALSRLPS